MGKALEVVNRFYELAEDKKGEGLEELIAEDMTFLGPMLKTSGAREFIEATRQFWQLRKATRILKQFENGNDVCAIFEMDIATPAGDIVTIEGVDWTQVADGKVASQRIYYDPREFDKAFQIEQ